MRAAIKSSEPDYYKDMAISHSTTLRTMRGIAPDAWLSYATYTGYTAKMMQDPPRFLDMIPDYALCQWTLTDMANTWPSSVKPMARHNIGYLHWCNRATKTEDHFYLKQIQTICQNADKAGFEGLVTYGELASDRPNVELFYLAWESFLWDPEMSMETFFKERLARLYGGVGPAKSLLEITQLVETKEKRRIAENLARARAMCKSAQRSASPEARERWHRLIAYLDSL